MSVEAARNVALKAKYPYIDDPMRAINYAISRGDMEAFDFLLAWQDGDWCMIEDDYLDFLTGGDWSEFL